MIPTLFMPCLQLRADFVQKTALHRKYLNMPLLDMPLKVVFNINADFQNIE